MTFQSLHFRNIVSFSFMCIYMLARVDLAWGGGLLYKGFGTPPHDQGRYTTQPHTQGHTQGRSQYDLIMVRHTPVLPRGLVLIAAPLMLTNASSLQSMDMLALEETSPCPLFHIELLNTTLSLIKPHMKVIIRSMNRHRVLSQ